MRGSTTGGTTCGRWKDRGSAPRKNVGRSRLGEGRTVHVFPVPGRPSLGEKFEEAGQGDRPVPQAHDVSGLSLRHRGALEDCLTWGKNHTIFNILATVVFCFPCAWPTRARICVQFPKRSAGGGGGGATERDAVRERFNISNVFHQRLASAPSRAGPWITDELPAMMLQWCRP